MRRATALVTGTAMVGLLATACTTTISFNGVRGEGPLVTETREVSSFDAVEIGGGVHVRLQVGEPQKVELEAEQNILDILDTVVEDGTLRIDNRDSYSSPRGVTLTVVVPSLSGIELSGGADGRAEGINAASLSVNVSGGAELQASGQVDRLDLTVSGGGQAHLDDLQAGNVQLDASGGAEAEVRASESISGDASGGATVRTSGDATVDVTSSGGASVS